MMAPDVSWRLYPISTSVKLEEGETATTSTTAVLIPAGEPRAP